MSPQTSGQDAGVQDEAGAQDNRLSMNPSDPKFADTIGAWKDGQQYALTVQVRQISPGEFEVIDAKEVEGAAEPGDAPAEETAESPSASQDSYSGNPALKDL